MTAALSGAGKNYRVKTAKMRCSMKNLARKTIFRRPVKTTLLGACWCVKNIPRSFWGYLWCKNCGKNGRPKNWCKNSKRQKRIRAKTGIEQKRPDRNEKFKHESKEIKSASTKRWRACDGKTLECRAEQWTKIFSRLLEKLLFSRFHGNWLQKLTFWGPDKNSYHCDVKNELPAIKNVCLWLPAKNDIRFRKNNEIVPWSKKFVASLQKPVVFACAKNDQHCEKLFRRRQKGIRRQKLGVARGREKGGVRLLCFDKKQT